MTTTVTPAARTTVTPAARTTVTLAATAVASSADMASGAGTYPGGGPGSPPGFHVRLDNFDGPFDLLLQLITAQRMDITEVALHRVTDDFLAYLRSMGVDGNLDQTTEFLVVAATLLDLKTARLLPGADVDDPADLALLESRDLLFARLLAYRAYQQVAEMFAELQATALRRYPRAVTLEDRYLDLLPEVRLGMDAEGFAAMAAAVFAPKPPPLEVAIDHIHSSPESVREHTAILVRRLGTLGAASFADLVADCVNAMQVVARFLGLLNLYRNASLAFEQPVPLGPLTIRWVGDMGEDGQPATDAAVSDAADVTVAAGAPVNDGTAATADAAAADEGSA